MCRFTRNTSTTGRVEGAHAVLKNWVAKSTADLDNMLLKLESAFKTQCEENETKRMCQIEKPLMHWSRNGDTIYEISSLIGQVSYAGINIIINQLNKRKKLIEAEGEDSANLKICPKNCHAKITHGLPCMHSIRIGELISITDIIEDYLLCDDEDIIDAAFAASGPGVALTEEVQPISLASPLVVSEKVSGSASEVWNQRLDVGLQSLKSRISATHPAHQDRVLTQINEISSTPVLRNPPEVPKKGRPKGAFGKRKQVDNSTRREPSLHEHVFKAVEKPSRKCSYCGECGHNLATCQKRQSNAAESDVEEIEMNEPVPNSLAVPASKEPKRRKQKKSPLQNEIIIDDTENEVSAQETPKKVRVINHVEDGTPIKFKLILQPDTACATDKPWTPARLARKRRNAEKMFVSGLTDAQCKTLAGTSWLDDNVTFCISTLCHPSMIPMIQ